MSHHSFPGTPVYAPSHSQSAHSSLGSPIGFSVNSNGPLGGHGSEGLFAPANGTGMTTSVTTGAIGLGLGMQEAGEMNGGGKAAVRPFSCIFF